MSQDPPRANRLAAEKSPYLLQHAYNPVDWQPWSDEAFAQAEREDKPVFLSIGYSTCHWCHVMEHESFEDEAVARLMNRAFVCLKVDREERPDIDNVYMTACQAMTGSGGWPLTIFMTPDKKPFHAATYIPRDSRFGRLGMLELIPRLEDYWRNQRTQVLEVAEQVATALAGQGTGKPPTKAAQTADFTALLRQGYEELRHRYDANCGGFGRAPKFPSPHNLSFLLRYWKRTGEPHALAMVEQTLQAMHRGGIWDQVGLGLHRYSTDSHWLVPHFEKMLYDQALLAIACLEAHQATGEGHYARMASEIFAYVLRDMTSPEGAFYSAEDADSEGVEGRFYVWTEAELRETLPHELAEVALSAYGVTAEGNYHDEASGEATGANILHLPAPVPDHLAEPLAQARELLLAARSERIRPGLDDKVLTDWNGQMIAALARGAQVLGDPGYQAAAGRAATFILTRMVSPEGRLLHRYRDGEAAIPAYLDDFACLIWGLIELYEADFEPHWLREALRLNEAMLGYFWDESAGGMYFSAPDHERLLARPKETYDGALPSGNSVALSNLLRLARLTGRTDLEARAAQLTQAFAQELTQAPAAHTQMLCGVDYAVGPAAEVVLSGADCGPLLQVLRGSFQPSLVVLARRDGQELADLAPFAAAHEPLGCQATAYVCHGQSCAPPTTDPQAMLELLR